MWLGYDSDHAEMEDGRGGMEKEKRLTELVESGDGVRDFQESRITFEKLGLVMVVRESRLRIYVIDRNWRMRINV
ncbi:hypothetical protein L195_g027147 [Trifolium pratense]|uniref:Uncharacterized protein n=1 Tax=Trifolium pratense TaxID=57577 RepID=A0A2K3KYA3_TRIPR|nr:hypothetical protein L195_g027147 [Trifolium pratense]